jgi:hypothetical protein
MTRTATLAATLVVLAGPPVHAAVRVTQGIFVGDALLTVTNQREVHTLEAPGRPATLMGRLPHRASNLVSDGEAAWAVTLGKRRPADVRLYQVHPARHTILELRAESSIDGRVVVRGVAGADARFVYLAPDLRIDPETGRLERLQLAPFPDLEVLRTVRRGVETDYLARDRAPADGQAARLWLLHSSDPGAAARDDDAGWLRVEAGAATGPVDLQADDRNLFLVFEQGRILRFDRGSLRLAEDLGPMLRPGKIRFFAADETSYWVAQETAAPADASAGEVEPDAVSLWRIDRTVLDGGPFHAGDVPPGFLPLGAGRGRIFFGSTAHAASPLVAVSAADGASRAYSIRGLHARRWAAVGRGFQDAGEVMLVGGMVSVVVAIVTLPIWIWFV